MTDVEDLQAPGGGRRPRAATALTVTSIVPAKWRPVWDDFSWRYTVRYAPIVFGVIAGMCEAMSLLVLWSEATIWVNLSGLVQQNLSVFGLILSAADDAGKHEYTAIQLAAAFPLLYMSSCVAYTVFHMKILDRMQMAGGQNTDASSLIMNASMFNRIQFALGFNYLNVLYHSANREDFPYTSFMHSVGVRLRLSQVDWYLPCVMPLIYLAVKFNLFARILRLMGVDEKGEPVRGNEKHEDLIRDGAKLVAAETRRLIGGQIPAGGSINAGAPMRLILSRLRGNTVAGSPGGSRKSLELTAASIAGPETRGGGRAEAPAASVSSKIGPPPPVTYKSSRFQSLDTFSGPSGRGNGAGAFDSPSDDPWAAPGGFQPSSSLGRGQSAFGAAFNTPSYSSSSISAPSSAASAPLPPPVTTAPPSLASLLKGKKGVQIP